MSARQVKLVHALGDEKHVPEADLDLEKKRVAVAWPSAGVMWFNFSTGLACGSPRGPWRLSDEDREHYCERAHVRPQSPRLRPLKRDRKKQDVHDPRQLWLKGTSR